MRSKAVIVARVLLGLVFSILVVALELFLAWSYRAAFRSLLCARNDASPAR